VLRPQTHPSTPTAVSPSAARFSSFPVVEGWGSSLVNRRYTSACGDVVGRGFARRSGTGTQRVMKVKVSEAHAGHCWES